MTEGRKKRTYNSRDRLEKARSTTADIAKAAEALFQRDGYAGVTMKDIARADVLDGASNAGFVAKPRRITPFGQLHARRLAGALNRRSARVEVEPRKLRVVLPGGRPSRAGVVEDQGGLESLQRRERLFADPGRATDARLDPSPEFIRQRGQPAEADRLARFCGPARTTNAPRRCPRTLDLVERRARFAVSGREDESSFLGRRQQRVPRYVVISRAIDNAQRAIARPCADEVGRCRRGYRSVARGARRHAADAGRNAAVDGSKGRQEPGILETPGIRAGNPLRLVNGGRPP